MISIHELCPHGTLTIPQEHEWNLQRLHFALNVVRRFYNKPMKINRGYSTEEDQIRIYAEKNRARAEAGLAPIDPPMGSCHLFGGAADVDDPTGGLRGWSLANENVLERLELYCERFDATPGYVHFQIFPPESGNRFFTPY